MPIKKGSKKPAKPAKPRKPAKPKSAKEMVQGKIKKPRSAKKPTDKAKDGALASAAKAVGAKFGGVFKRKPDKIHTLAQADYRMTPFFKKPRVLSKPTLSLEQLIVMAHPPDVRTALTVHLKTFRKARVPAVYDQFDMDWAAFYATTLTDDNSHYHQVLVMAERNAKGKITKKSKCVVSCSCPRWVFSGSEYRLAKKGASFIYYSNGQAPTQPSNKSLCKHGIQALRHLYKSRTVI
jgi:hypothetical protein